MWISSILSGTSFAVSAARYLDLVEDRVHATLEQLKHAKFKAAMHSMEQLKAIKSEDELKPLIREARSQFNEAVGLEEGVEQALCYLGLALCYHHLGERSNEIAALRSMQSITFKDPTESLKYKTKLVRAGLLGLAIGNPYLFVKTRQMIDRTEVERNRKLLNELKVDAKQWLDGIDD
jgi:hypothetical protein